LEIYKSFNSISKISYVRNSKLFFRHSSTRKYNGVAPVISTPPSGPSIDTTASQAPIAPEDPEKPPVRPMVDENSAAGKAGVNAEDWFLTRVTRISALKNLLMSMVLTDLANLNQRRLLERL
jgi:hypothetical protein